MPAVGSGRSAHDSASSERGAIRKSSFSTMSVTSPTPALEDGGLLEHRRLDAAVAVARGEVAASRSRRVQAGVSVGSRSRVPRGALKVGIEPSLGRQARGGTDRPGRDAAPMLAVGERGWRLARLRCGAQLDARGSARWMSRFRRPRATEPAITVRRERTREPRRSSSMARWRTSSLSDPELDVAPPGRVRHGVATRRSVDRSQAIVNGAGRPSSHGCRPRRSP